MSAFSTPEPGSLLLLKGTRGNSERNDGPNSREEQNDEEKHGKPRDQASAGRRRLLCAGLILIPMKTFAGRKEKGTDLYQKAITAPNPEQTEMRKRIMLTITRTKRTDKVKGNREMPLQSDFAYLVADPPSHARSETRTDPFGHVSGKTCYDPTDTQRPRDWAACSLDPRSFDGPDTPARCSTVSSAEKSLSFSQSSSWVSRQAQRPSYSSIVGENCVWNTTSRRRRRREPP
ncbi:hypothetical protein BU25DRAFT_420633 [Macroventuria anomochaeta]|uniref:Uncharacterized protein n=1 Tax=Macroventuria anomochaeta TaxID=301207 RepID=A0ACB6S6C1_9PLEO|nr:uncharacterized protein BU25DRAFT_420633 [Macroventuria anomochaeta]KAF2628672.1 hypothetical protein BU25DRAFT_420633 [Macroventuria anomochaeta]